MATISYPPGAKPEGLCWRRGQQIVGGTGQARPLPATPFVPMAARGSPDHHRKAWEAACRLLQRGEKELRDTVALWELGLVAFEVLIDAKDEVHVLRDLERTLFKEAFPLCARAGDEQR